MGGFNPFSKKDWDKKVGDPIKKGASKAKKGVSKAKNEVSKIDDKIIEGAKYALVEFAETALVQFIKLLKFLFSKFVRCMRGLFKRKPSLKGLINDTAGGLGIGPVELIFSNFADRAVAADKLLTEFVKKGEIEGTRTNIMRIVKSLNPTRVKIEAQGQLAAFVVSSNSLEVKGWIEVPLDLFWEMGDDLLAEMGVPK